MRRVLASLALLQLLFAAAELTPSRSMSYCCKKMCAMRRACGSPCAMDRSQPLQAHRQTLCVAPPTSAAFDLGPVARIAAEVGGATPFSERD